MHLNTPYTHAPALNHLSSITLLYLWVKCWVWAQRVLTTEPMGAESTVKKHGKSVSIFNRPALEEKMNVSNLITNAKNFVDAPNVHYLYGYKGEIVNLVLNKALREQYPRIWTDSYFNYAESIKGQIAMDCSGFVCLAAELNYQIGSWEINDKWEKGSFKKGECSWKEGHVAIISDVDGDYITTLEAKNRKEGLITRKTKIGDVFKKSFKIPGVNYETVHYALGWNKDEIGWWYSTNGTDYIKSSYAFLPWSKGKSWFAFDEKGYCIITDKNGVIQEPKYKK